MRESGPRAREGGGAGAGGGRLSHSSASGSVGPLLGVWEGGAYVLDPPGSRNPLVSCSPCYTVSLAIGWRWNGNGELYLAPKLGILNGMKVPFPFQRYAD